MNTKKSLSKIKNDNFVQQPLYLEDFYYFEKNNKKQKDETMDKEKSSVIIIDIL